MESANTDPLYVVVDWDKHFEINRTRELKQLTWVPFPNKHDGDGYTELISHERGAAIYGCWCALVQIASKCDPRGTLLRDSKTPHTAETIARMCRLPALECEIMLSQALKVGWLKVCDDPALSCDDPAPSCASRAGARVARFREGKGMEEKGMEEKGMEGKGVEGPAGPRVVVFEFACVGSEQDWPLYEDKIAEYRETYPDLNMDAELRTARQWCRDNPAKRKTHDEMPKFINDWLKRSQNNPSRRAAPVAERVGSGGDDRSRPGRELSDKAIRDAHTLYCQWEKGEQIDKDSAQKYVSFLERQGASEAEQDAAKELRAVLDDAPRKATPK